MATINRTGKVSFYDANLSVWEDPAGPITIMGEWEREFKRDVFTRIVQQLNRLGWTVVMPEIKPHDVKAYGGNVARWSAERKRDCSKGDLRGHLETSGRTVKFEMWQDVANIDHPNGGRYEFDKAKRMPYVLRLEMERTRRRIRDYLCGVMEGYVFDDTPRDRRCAFGDLTAAQWLDSQYQQASHYRGTDWAEYLAANSSMVYNLKSADGVMLDHGQRVWYFDDHGRAGCGVAHYNINSMWWVVSGRYAVGNKSASQLYTAPPENLRHKRNADRRRRRLEGELATAVKAMNFERAAVLRDIVFPTDEPLFMLWHGDHGAYHRAGFRGYSTNTVDAGKFTAAELRDWNVAPNRIVPAGEVA